MAKQPKNKQQGKQQKQQDVNPDAVEKQEVPQADSQLEAPEVNTPAPEQTPVEPEPVEETEAQEQEQVSAVTKAVRVALNNFINHHTGDVANSVEGSRAAVNSLHRAYVLALSSGDEVKNLMFEIMQAFHDNKAAFSSHTLYQVAPKNDHSFYMALSQWIYEVTRNPRNKWGKAMGELGHPSTQRIMGLSPNPNVGRGFEGFVGSVYES